MPFNEDITEAEENRFEEGGSVKDTTKKERERFYLEFEKYFLAKSGGLTIPEQLAANPDILSKTFSTYFWSMKINTTVSLICF